MPSILNTKSLQCRAQRLGCALWLGVAAFGATQVQAQSTRALLEDLGVRVERLEQTVQGEAMLELLARVESLAQQNREQRGELDLLLRELETLRRQQQDVVVDQERRLSALERALERTLSAVSGGGAAVDSADAAEAPAVSSESPATAASASGVPETAEGLYARALAALNAGEYPAAIAAFEVFLERHAGHALANNARYWTGQAFFLLRDYARALEFFGSVGSDMPDIGKVADALLKRGLCEIELGRNAAARQSLQAVITRYPDSAAAPLARQTLARLGASAGSPPSSPPR